MKRGRKPKAKHHVPVWADKDLAADLEKMDALARESLAAKLEEKVSQLRGFATKRIDTCETVAIAIRPNAVDSILYYYNNHAGKEDKDISRETKLSTGARWILEVALTMLPKICERTNQLIRYRTAEGVEDSHLHESETAKSLAKCKADFENEDGDDKAGEGWKDKE